jgi:hypothetical protein
VVVDSALGGLKMLDGEHWQATEAERKELEDVTAELWALHNWPRLGPWLRLGALIIMFVANHKKRREAMARLWAWALNRKYIAPAAENPAQ